jgi:hypothetical protein
MNNDQTTKVQRESKHEPLESSSPIGHEEIEQQIAVESINDGAAVEPVKPSAAERQKRKKPEPEQPLNPKRQVNSRPD